MSRLCLAKFFSSAYDTEMNFNDLKLRTLGINAEKFGKIFSFVDYGNVNYWYEKDRQGWDGNQLGEMQKLIVDIEKLGIFINSFAIQKRFYYGWNNRNKGAWHINIKAERCGFTKITKPIQFIKHFLPNGTFIEIPKSNFDVEITVDAIRLVNLYNTFCLFSGDSDFAFLLRFLKKRKKKIIVVASGQVFHTLKELADLYIPAQSIKADIASIKETTPISRRGLDIGSASGGQDGFHHEHSLNEGGKEVNVNTEN